MSSLEDDRWDTTVASLATYSKFIDGDFIEDTEFVHTPHLIVEGSIATIWTTHDITEEHWVDSLFLRNQDNVVIAHQTFLGTDVRSRFSTSLPKGTTSLTAYANCNLHGLWKTEALEIFLP